MARMTVPPVDQSRGSRVHILAVACSIICVLVVSHGTAVAQDVLVVEGDRVGIGTETPGGDLHIFGAAAEDSFSAIGPDASSDAFNFGYSGVTFGQASGFFNVRPATGASAPNPALYFATGNVDRLIIDNEGFVGIHLDGTLGPGFDPGHPIHSQTSGARLTVGGVWATGSSRALKENVRPLELPDAISAVMELDPVRFNYRVDPEDPQVGFIAEDVPALVASPDRKTLAPLEIVGALTRVVQEQQKLIEELARQVEVLKRERRNGLDQQ